MRSVSSLGRFVAVGVAAVTVTALLGVPVTAAEQAEPDVLWGSIRYSECGPGATYDGIANTFIMGSFMPVAAARAGGAMQLVFELLQNPAMAEALGTDMASVSDELRRSVPSGTPPIRARYDAYITFQLEAKRDGSGYRLKSGSISWSTENTTVVSVEDITLQDSFRGADSELLDPAEDVIDLTFEDRDDGSIGWSLDVEVTHEYWTRGTSSWVTPVATISMTRDRSEMTLTGETVFGPAPIPPLPPDLFADDTKTVGYTATGSVFVIGDQILKAEAWTNILEGSQLAQVEIRADCAPVIVEPEPPRLVFSEADVGTIETTARVLGPAFTQKAVRWEFPDVPFDAVYEPKDQIGPRVDFVWRKLPERNDQFGEYDLWVEYTDPAIAAGCGSVRPLTVEVFFPIDGRNNPGGTDPNWFYYWMQTSARNGIQDVEVIRCQSRQAGAYRNGDRIIRLCDPQTYVPQYRTVDKAELRYIDAFAITLIHEDRHRRNWFDWWVNENAYSGIWEVCADWDHDGKDDQRPGCKIDSDRDGVPDDVEPLQTAPNGRNLGLIVGDKFSCLVHPDLLAQVPEKKNEKGEVVSAGIDDEECTAYWEEIRWQVGSARDEDWAAPGTQWGEGRP